MPGTTTVVVVGGVVALVELLAVVVLMARYARRPARKYGAHRHRFAILLDTTRVDDETNTSKRDTINVDEPEPGPSL